ncbi:endonuclease/exonuclease/phosphatase family protein [Streptosporangium saharense]|uniref:endonuclease/exonuclease/phosphatase family protein n=1 Tax=Streptosporangium saharense TaxID=1706840 RepID=UPI00343A1D1A
MRVVTFNLCNGGIDNGNDTRLRRQLDRLAGLDADVIALQEAKHWAEPNTRLFHGGQPFHLAKRTLGMDGFLVPSEHDGCHLALFVRTGRVQVLQEKHTVGAPYWHAVGHLRALVDGRVTSFVNVHSAPSTPRLREIEAESLALKVRKGEPVIMMGDWNAVPTTYAGTQTRPPGRLRPERGGPARRGGRDGRHHPDRHDAPPLPLRPDLLQGPHPEGLPDRNRQLGLRPPPRHRRLRPHAPEPVTT